MCCRSRAAVAVRWRLPSEVAGEKVAEQVAANATSTTMWMTTTMMMMLMMMMIIRIAVPLGIENEYAQCNAVRRSE